MCSSLVFQARIWLSIRGGHVHLFPELTIQSSHIKALHGSNNAFNLRNRGRFFIRNSSNLLRGGFLESYSDI